MLSLTAPIDARALAVARIGIGLGALVSALETRNLLLGVARGVALSMPLWDWLPRVTDGAVLIYTAVLAAAAVAVTVGFGSRVAGPVIAAAALWVFAWDQQVYTNNFMLVMWLSLWLAFSRADAAWSLAALRHGRRPVTVGDGILLMTQLSACYGFAAAVKLNPLFLSGDTLQAAVATDLPSAVFPLLGPAAVATELLLAFGLWFGRTRALAALAGVGLHAGIMVTMQHPALIGFCFASWGVYALFLARPVSVVAEVPVGPLLADRWRVDAGR